MNVKFKLKGIDQAIKKINDLEEKARSLNEKRNVPITELLTPSFMRRNTKFSSFDAMVEASGFRVETQEDFEKIPDDEWDKYIAVATSFPNWQAMLKEAGAEWAKTKLGL